MARNALSAVTVGLLLLCYASTLAGMAHEWWTDEDMGHGFLVPVVVAWIIWRERESWASLPIEGRMWGVPLVVVGGLLHLVGALGVGLFVSALGFLVSLTGAVVWFGGTRLLRAWAFPLALCLFMLPKLAIVYNQTTLPLQLVASRLAAGMLTFAGIGVIRAGNILDVGGHQVLVAEACNGIRFLLPLSFLGVLLGYLISRSSWIRVTLLMLSLPLAIAANAIRVAASAWIPAFDAGLPHLAMGTVVFLLAMAIMAAAGFGLSRTAVERRV